MLKLKSFIFCPSCKGAGEEAASDIFPHKSGVGVVDLAAYGRFNPLSITAGLGIRRDRLFLYGI